MLRINMNARVSEKLRLLWRKYWTTKVTDERFLQLYKLDFFTSREYILKNVSYNRFVIYS